MLLQAMIATEDGPAADEGRKLGIRMLPLGVHDLRPADDC